MIHIKKTEIAPKILTEKGKKENEKLCDSYNSGVRDFEFNSKIYGAKSVKNKLKKIQHDKCCFCESKVSHITYGDVEHFRPKKGYCQDSNEPLIQPGYYWLAYEWSNLFLSCSKCNQRYKRNLFPLQNPDKRAKDHNSDISLEKPLFINPSLMNPEDYISFREEIPFAIEDNPMGVETIKSLGLDRQELNEQRRKKFEEASILYDITADKSVSSEIKARAKKWIENNIKDHAEYAAMIRAAVRSVFCIK